MCNAGSWRHHTQKESKRITRGRKSKNEKLISRGLFGLEKCGKLKRFPLETRLPSQSESNMWPQRVPRRQEPSMQNRVPNVKKKKKGWRRRNHTYIHIKYLVTPNQSMCIHAKVNKTPHIPASVWGMDDTMNRGATNGASQTTGIVQSHNQGRIKPWDRHPIMIVGSRRAMSPSSVFGPLQNIYSPPCRWKNNSPLVHRRSVTKKEWISPLMFQQIKRGTPAHA